MLEEFSSSVDSGGFSSFVFILIAVLMELLFIKEVRDLMVITILIAEDSNLRIHGTNVMTALQVKSGE